MDDDTIEILKRRSLGKTHEDNTDGTKTPAGNVNAWVTLCKGHKEGQLMKSTKAFEVFSKGCCVQTTTLEVSTGGRRPSDALVWIPGVTLAELKRVFE